MFNSKKSSRHITKIVQYLLLPILIIVPSVCLYAEPAQVDITVSNANDYVRPDLLADLDRQKNREFSFVQGLEIVTDIRDVKVFIQENEAGRTQYENNHQETGRYRIRLEKPGYPDLSFWVNIRASHRTTVIIRYNPLDSPAKGYQKGEKTRFYYSEVNPDDPSWYTRLYGTDLLESGEIPGTLLIQDKDENTILAIHPQRQGEQFLYTLDRDNSSEKPLDEGHYTLATDSLPRQELRISRNYSRRGSSYFSGFSGLALVPSAQILFPGSFQFGSSISFESVSDKDSSHIPVSFFMCFSPLKRWESAFEGKLSFINESDSPSVQINSSQKLVLLKNSPFQLSLGLRGSYLSKMRDFSQTLNNTLIRDPGGISLYIPLQYRYKKWYFFFSPEGQYSLYPPGSSENPKGEDFSGNLRWGISHVHSHFSGAISWAAYLPSGHDSPIILQTALEGSLYVPGSPMFINLQTVFQQIINGEYSKAFAVNAGFLF